MQTELKTNNTVTNSFIAQTERQADIVKKIEELNRWQEEQKKLLEAKQSKQRQMLGLEQRSVYQMLGIQSESEMSESENVPNDMQVEKFNINNGELFQECEDKNSEGSIRTSQLDVEDTDEIVLKESEMASYRTLTSGYGTEFCEEMVQPKPKKPFLRRGEGLKQRFNIHPDELKLNNLPKYKYANAHPRLRMKPRNKLNKTKNVRGKPSYEVNPSIEQIALCDAQEQRFQKLLIASKNTCSSTPDAKFPKNKTKHENTATENATMSSRLNEAQASNGSKTPVPVTHIMAWSKILDPLEIKPLQVPRNCLSTLPQTEESIFELLEQKAKEGSFDLDSTCLKEFLTGKISEKQNESDDHIPVQEHLKTKRLEPVIALKNKEIPSSQNSNELEIEEEESESNTDTGSVDSDDTSHNTIETTNSSYPQRSLVKVRFSDSNETHEYEEQAETLLNDASRLSAGTTGREGEGDASNNELFAQFKEVLFAALQSKADQHLSNDSILNTISDTTLTPKDSVTVDNFEDNSIYPIACKELQEKMDMVKMRLTELEKEIQNFKDNNILLMKAKQDHELQKSLYAQEHLEAMEGIKDEKIRMEIYLHDERVKLEEEKRKFELNTKMKNQGIIAKERKECERLREHVSQLEMQLKSKEANHTTAQARLRSQIRNLEREHSKLYDQIEELKRENKRLENENLKIRREQNNKILLEINRNIAKLAPKEIQNSSYPMPEEGPPTLGASRTTSKGIDLPSSTRNTGKVNKTTITNCSNVKPTRKKKTTKQRYDELEIVEENEQTKLQQQINVISSDDDDEDEDDILREPETIPDTDNMPKVQQNKITNRASHKDQNHAPAPPPSSPRSRAGCNNAEMKREIVNDDGSKDIWYPNGNLKKISSDGMIIRMLYFNKDIKETNINEGTVKYYYAETNTWHTTYLDGLEILEFPNGQVEHRHKSGIVEVHYPNNSIKIVDPKDERKQEEWRFQDGTHLVQMRNGDKILSLPNGQKEIHNKLHKRREYPDGTVKIVYPDGSTETRYSNGRIRLKDKHGNLVMDTDLSK